MIPPDDELGEDAFAELLGEYDEAFAKGRTPQPRDTPLDPELRQRLAEAEVCLALLESAWPRANPAMSDDAADASLPSRWAAAPTRIGRFEVRRELGRGGNGVVFLAYDPPLRREVALKLPRPEALVTDELRLRFRREAEAAARLQHPNLVPIYEAGQDGPLCYLVMAYSPGPTLAAWLRHQAAPVRPMDAARLVGQLADAVAYMHSQGVLHRDIKPSNILLQTADSRIQISDLKADESQSAIPNLKSAIPKLTDFGLAKLTEGASQQTRTGTVLGTPAYMAPEQADGRVAAIGPCTDVYALGILLYELLTGRPPFQGASDLDTVRQLVEDEPLPPRQLRRGVPRDLQTICLKCLEKEPQRRYASAAHVTQELRAFQDGKPILARPARTWERAAKWVRRRPAVALFLVLGILALFGLAGGTYYLNDVSATAEEYRKSAEREKQQHSEAEELALLGLRLKYADGIVRAAGLRAAKQSTDMRAALEKEQPAAGQVDVRGFEWHYLHGRSMQLRWLRGHRARVDLVTFSSDGKWCASASGDLTFKVWDTATGKLQTSQNVNVSSISKDQMTPGGMRIVSVGDKPGGIKEIQVSTVSTGKIIATWTNSLKDLSALTISPDGQLVAVAGRAHDTKAHEIRLRDLALGLERLIRPADSGFINYMCFSPDGKTLALSYCIISQNDFCIELRDVATGQKKVPKMCGHTHFIFALAFSPDGRLLASGSHDARVLIWDTANGKKLRCCDPPSFYCATLAFSPDGKSLAACAQENLDENSAGIVQVWDSVNERIPAKSLKLDRKTQGLSFSEVLSNLVDAQLL